MANSTTQFGGFLTNVGIAQQSNSAALGVPWNITHMLIGDAGGEPGQTPDPTPKPTQTALVRQVLRAQLNALYQSPVDPAVLVAELVLPPETGGWWIRELALEDANGNFVAVAMPAPSYKPLLVQGSGRTQTIRMHVVFGNVANITLKIDPSIVLATRDYVDKAREATELYARNQDKAHTDASDPHPQYLLRSAVAKDSGPLAWLGDAAGTANALALTLKHTETTLSAYAAGQRFQFKATASNTGAVTAKINGLAAVAVKKSEGGGLVDLVGGDIRVGALYDLSFDGTYFQLGGGVGAGKAFERFSFEASVGQTVFNVLHTIGSTIVMRNGREVTGYVADGLKITLATPCEFGDAVEVLAFSSFQIANAYTKAEIQALLAAASPMVAGMQVFATPGTFDFVVPMDAKAGSVFDVEVWGGGGGGGGAPSGAYASGGAGGGGYSLKRLTGLVPGSTIQVTVGAGGALGAAGVAGGVGGTSSFGVHCSATGGGGGKYVSSSSPGVAGGVGVGGDLNIAGDCGECSEATVGGNGGMGARGGGGGVGGFGSAGLAGAAPGGGGGGGDGSFAGGAGGNGAVVIKWR